MRLSWSSSNICVICSSDALLVSCLRCDELHHKFLEWPTTTNTVATKRHTEKALHNSRSSNNAQPSDSTSQSAVGSCISLCEQYLAVITADKRLMVWASQQDLKEPSCCCSFKFYSSWTLVKRPVDLVFDSNSEHILVADKTGDVLQFSLRPEDSLLYTSAHIQASKSAAADDEEGAGSPAPVLLGHLSMLLTLTMSPCGRFVATGDRDEKVRVSRYPRAHNISSFCLGHSEFVAQLRTLPSRPHALLSASGDGTLRIWNLEDGEELSVTDTQIHSDQYRMAIEDSSSQTFGDDTNSSSQEPKSVSNQSSTKSSLPSESTSSNPKQAADAESSLQQPGRDRVVPQQCAITCIAVTSPKTNCSNGSKHCDNASSTNEQNSKESTSDLVAVGFDRSRSLALYGLTADNTLRHLYTAQLPVPAATLTWLDGNTLAVLCPEGEGNKQQAITAAGIVEDRSPVLVWRWSGEDIAIVHEHSLAKFAAQNADRFKGDLPDATVLFKQRFDNVAEYQKKKQTRLQQKQQEQLSCKRIKLSTEETGAR